MGELSDSGELLPALAQLPGHLLWRSRARVTAALNETMPAGIDFHAYAALLALAGGATRSQQNIAEMIAVSRTTMTKVACALDEQGMVERVRDLDDRRSYALTRLPTGATAARRWRRHVIRVEKALTPSFTTADRENLRGLLRRIVDSDLAPGTPEPLLDSIAFLVTQAHITKHQEFTEALEPIGLEPSQFAVLTAIRATGPISQAEVARLIGVSGPRVVQMADDIEALGLLERRRPAEDRRTQMLHLTTRTDSVLDQATRSAVQTGQDLLADLSPAERAHLMDLLRRLVTGG